MKKHQTKAFTLVELIIVITILAILAIIGFVSYQRSTLDARDSSRITSLKTVYKGLTISYIQKQTYSTPDDYIDVVGVSKQGYVGDSVSKSIRGEGFKDPKDNNRFLYSLDYTGKKIQLSGFLENNNKLLLSLNNSFFNQAFAGNIDYTSRYIYTIGNNVGILLNSTTNAPVNETISTGSIDLTTNTGSYTVIFADTGAISGSGQTLLTNISIIQSSCVLGNTVVTNGGQISAYNTTSVAYDQTCTPISRTCNNGVLSGDTSYKYDTCIPANALNCTRTTYNGYSVPSINHGITQTISKAITGGTSSIDATCTNGALSYGTETTTCSTNYTLTGNSCVANTQNVACTGLKTNSSWNTATNILQTWNGTIWLPTNIGAYNTTASTTTCNYKCNSGYTWDNTNCYKLACTTGTYNTSTNKCDTTTSSACNYTATVTITTNCRFIYNGDGDYFDSACSVGNSCPSGGGWYYDSDNLIQCYGGDIWDGTHTVSQLASTNSYSCPSGGTLSGTTCLKTCTTTTSVSPACTTPVLNGGIRKCY